MHMHIAFYGWHLHALYKILLPVSFCQYQYHKVFLKMFFLDDLLLEMVTNLHGLPDIQDSKNNHTDVFRLH